MAITVTYLIMNIIRTYAIYIFVDNFLQRKRWSSRTLLIAYGVYYAVAAVFYLDSELFSFFHNIVMNLSFAFLIGWFFYKTTYQKCLMCAVFIYILSIASEDFAIVILSLLFKTSLSSLLSTVHLVMMGIIISMFMLLVIVKLMNPLFKKQSADMNRLYWFTVFSLPIGCIYIMHTLIRQLEQGKSDELFALTTIFLLFTFNILVFYLYDNILKEKATKYENIMLIQQNEAYENQALLVQDFQADLQGQRHDLHNHISTIKELVEQKQKDELLTYLHDWSNDIVAIEPGIHTENTIVNAMVNSKLYMANLQNTVLYVNVDIPAILNLSRTDLVVILGNLFDNALEACLNLPPEERVVRSDINYMHNTLTISIINTYDKSKLDLSHGKPLTTKKDSKVHGIGLNRIEQIVDKYNGLFQYRFSELKGKDLFVAEVLLYIH